MKKRGVTYVKFSYKEIEVANIESQIRPHSRWFTAPAATLAHCTSCHAGTLHQLPRWHTAPAAAVLALTDSQRPYVHGQSNICHNSH